MFQMLKKAVRAAALFTALCLFSGSFAVSAVPEPTPEPAGAWEPEMEKYLRKYVPELTDAEVEAKLAARRIDPEKPMIALTFDDGPIPGITDQILDILDQYGVRATFFILGYRLRTEGTDKLLERMLSLGCEIGSHTQNHDNLRNVSRKTIRTSLAAVNDKVEELTGYRPVTLRPPGGRTGNRVIEECALQNMAVVLWSQSGNVHETDPQRIAENVLRQKVNGKELQDRDIVLLHDTHKEMIEAVSIMVPQLIDAGYQLVTVRELLSLCPEGCRPGLAYFSATDYHGKQRGA